MPTHRVLRVPRAQLVAAVEPEPLRAVLDALKAAGTISGYEDRPHEVVIWGDLIALEARLGMEQRPKAQPEPHDQRGEYYRLCRWFCTTATFRRMAPQQRAIWRMHSQGASQSEICLKLNVTEMRVRTAIRGARLAADLPAVTMTATPRNSAGRPRRAERPRCRVEECASEAEAKGYCNRHYQQAKKLVLDSVFSAAGEPQPPKKIAQ